MVFGPFLTWFLTLSFLAAKFRPASAPPGTALRKTSFPKAPGFLERNVPIPAKFYVNKKDADLLGPKSENPQVPPSRRELNNLCLMLAGVMIPLTLFLGLLQVAMFAGFIYYYSMSAQWVTDISIESEYDYGGSSYNCTPLAADSFYSVRFNYETCRALYSEPSTTSVLSKPTATTTVWRYYPFLNIVDKGVANTATFTAYYYTDLGLQDANATAIFDSLKTLNDCSSVGADDSSGFTTSEKTESAPFDINKSVRSSNANAAGVTYPCAISQAQAISMFKKYNELIDPCFFTKINAPFSCVKRSPLYIIQRLSLSYANTMLFQGIVSGFIVQLFFSTQVRKMRKGIADEAPA